MEFFPVFQTHSTTLNQNAVFKTTCTHLKQVKKYFISHESKSKTYITGREIK